MFSINRPIDCLFPDFVSMCKLRIFWCLCLSLSLIACSSSKTNAKYEGGTSDRRVSQIRSTDDGISGIAAREVIRRQEGVRRADSAALRANRYSSQGDHEAAVRSYRQALDALPSGD
jgi:Tfp pilus assembly protein PilF